MGQAEENVKAELGLLERSTDAAFKSFEGAYSSLEECLLQTKHEGLKSVSDLSSRRSRLLNEQLDLIKKKQDESNRYRRDRLVTNDPSKFFCDTITHMAFT